MTVNYDIIATLGPSTADESAWDALCSAGATAFRLNTSHLLLHEVDVWLERLQEFFTARGSSLPVVLDLQGSKWRLGEFSSSNITEGQRVRLVQAEKASGEGMLPVPHADFFAAAAESDGIILLNDAKIRLRIESSDIGELCASVIDGGPIGPKKGITYRTSAYRVEALSEKDRSILLRTAGHANIRYALSYIKDAVEAMRFREQVDAASQQSSARPHLTAKLERQTAIEEAGSIAQHVDALWLCRGDLGAELGITGMASAVYKFGRQVRVLQRPALLAGQVLEHMVNSPAPTRSEVCALYAALQEGYSGFVLSDEVAIGRYPVESCQAAAMFRSHF